MEHPMITLGRTYRAEHPDVDWNTHDIGFRRVDSAWEVIGHRPKDPRVEAMLDRCCCHPDQPRGHEWGRK